MTFLYSKFIDREILKAIYTDKKLKKKVNFPLE